jgi:hypothetical protein
MGRNLAISNSFYLQFTNTGSTDFNMNLFNGGSLQKTRFDTSFVWVYNLLAVTNLTNSVFTNNTTVIILDDLANVISSVNMLAGQTLVQYLALANPLVDINGNTGVIDIQQEPSTNTYNIRIGGLPSISKIGFSPDGSVLATPTAGTFAVANPFVTVQSTIPIEQIENSETGNSYRVMSIDLYSQQQEQLSRSIQYGNKNANGNRVIYNTNPVTDPYALGIVIFGADVEGMIIDVETIFRYTINAFSQVRLTFNYVKGNLELMRGLNQAFIQRLIVQYATDKKILDAERFRELIIQ